MKCPFCGNKNNEITKEIRKDNKNFRFVKCLRCKKTYKTIEYLAERKDYKHLYVSIAKKLKTLLDEINERNEIEW